MTNCFSQTQSRVFQSVNASAVGAEYTTLLEEANRSQEGTQKQLHILISLEFTLVAKCNACFIKKKSASLKVIYDSVDVRISVSNKRQVSRKWWCCLGGWGGGVGWGVPATPTLTLNPRLKFTVATKLVETLFTNKKFLKT